MRKTWTVARKLLQLTISDTEKSNVEEAVPNMVRSIKYMHWGERSLEEGMVSEKNIIIIINVFIPDVHVIML